MTSVMLCSFRGLRDLTFESSICQEHYGEGVIERNTYSKDLKHTLWHASVMVWTFCTNGKQLHRSPGIMVLISSEGTVGNWFHY